VLAPVASLCLTKLYIAWIHSSHSPRPAHAIESPDFSPIPK
jgi:hypothetical protein